MFRATKVFTDRTEPRSVFQKSFNNFFLDRKKSEIIVYYGVGGIGKTKLLRELLNMADDLYYKQTNKSDMNKVYLSLDAYDYNNPVSVLMGIRKQLNIDCSLFDYALLQYSVKTKHTVQDISRKLVGIDSPLTDIFNELLSFGMGSVSVPTNILRKSVEIIKDINIKRKYKEEIESIKDYSEFEIYQRLPYYLGISVLNAAEKGKKHVFFIDSYESILLRTNNSALVEDSEEWLKEFFISSENLLLVIACREKFKWYEDDVGWNEYLNQHILERLVDEDSMYFLGQVPIKEEIIKQSIVKLAQGVPLYLDMCVDIYENTVNSGNVVSESIFNVTGNKIIGRYIRHLKDNEKYAIKVLSIPYYFNVEITQYLLKKENLSFSYDEIHDLFDKSIFLEIDEYQGLFKIDESVRLHVLENITLEKRRSVIYNIIDFIRLKLKGGQSSIAFQFFQLLWPLIIADYYCFKTYVNELIEILYTLIEMGYWVEIHNIIKSFLNSENIYIRSFCSLAELFYLRRTGSIEKAQILINENMIDITVLGNYKYLYDFLRIHILHLSGEYDIALEEYKILKERIDLVKENISNHIYYTVNIKYTDLLFLKGQFKTALKMIDNLVDSNNIHISDKAEILRVRGHIYRFNFMFHEAAIIYHSALELFSHENSASFEGKIYNNLVETYCYTEPETALEYAKHSIEINAKIDAKIELGKTYAASSIAYSLSNRFEEAVEYANKSIELQKITGYVSGLLFGEISLFISKYLSTGRTIVELQNHIKSITEITDKINVYNFLKLTIYIITGNESKILELEQNSQWIDFNRTKNEIDKIFNEVGAD